MAKTALTDIREVSWFGIGPAVLQGEWEHRSVQVLLGDVHEKLSCKSDNGLFSGNDVAGIWREGGRAECVAAA